MRRLLPAAALSLSALVLLPSAAVAAPPANDNYLASIPIAPQEQVTVQADTTEATTQPDLFNPSRDGQPLGGGDPETLACNGVGFGKTVWYDFAPPVNYGVQLRATGFAAAVAVYEWNPTTSRITRQVGCSANGEDLLIDLEGKKSYTFQVGGVGGAGGLLSLRMDAFPDSDADDVLDALDKCREVPGIEGSGGCPPSLRGRTSPSVSFDRAAGGLRITRLVVDSVPKGAKVTARCTGCGSQTVKAKKQGRISLSKLVGKTARAGGSIEVRVTMGRTGNGRYRFGATGAYVKWPVRADGLGARLTRCLNVKSGKIERCR
jgi:hypothetical protein